MTKDDNKKLLENKLMEQEVGGAKRQGERERDKEREREREREKQG